MREDKYKEIVKFHHRYDIIGGLRMFFCLTLDHAYETKQNFDFCPSCGECVREVKELISMIPTEPQEGDKYKDDENIIHIRKNGKWVEEIKS